MAKIFLMRCKTCWEDKECPDASPELCQKCGRELYHHGTKTGTLVKSKRKKKNGN